MKFIHFFLFCEPLALPYPDSESGSGSTDLINPDPDAKHYCTIYESIDIYVHYVFWCGLYMSSNKEHTHLSVWKNIKGKNVSGPFVLAAWEDVKKTVIMFSWYPSIRELLEPTFLIQLPRERGTNLLFPRRDKNVSSFCLKRRNVCTMDQIYIKTPNPKYRLFLQNWPIQLLGGRCLSVWDSPPSYEPILPPPLTHCSIHVYRGGGGGRELTREKVIRAMLHKAGSKIPAWLTVSPVYKLY